MAQELETLRATERVDAPVRDVRLFANDLSPTHRALRGHAPALLRLFDADDLGDDIAGAMDDHARANIDALLVDLSLVVHGDVAHGDPAHDHRLDVGYRRQHSRAADVALDRLHVRLGFLGGGFSFHFADGSLEHLRIEFKADRFDVSALLPSEKISRTAQFEIKRRDFESGSQVRKFFQSSQTAARHRGQLDLWRKEQVGVGSAIGAANPTAKLVKLGESVTVGSINKDGVAERDVQAVFNDRGGDENVGFVMHEFEHHLFEFRFRHLSMADDDAGSRGEFLQLGGDFVDALDTVVDEVYLASALEFLFQCRLN